MVGQTVKEKPKRKQRKAETAESSRRKTIYSQSTVWHWNNFEPESELTPQLWPTNFHHEHSSNLDHAGWLGVKHWRCGRTGKWQLIKLCEIVIRISTEQLNVNDIMTNEPPLILISKQLLIVYEAPTRRSREGQSGGREIGENKKKKRSCKKRRKDRRKEKHNGHKMTT